jgi:hypothetical protein
MSSMPQFPLENAIDQVLRAASAQLEMWRDGQRRPEIDRGGLSESCLALLLEAIGAQARILEGNAELPASLRAALLRFGEEEKKLRAGSAAVSDHLLELAQGWECSACGSDVPAAAQLLPPLGEPERTRARLLCKRCGAATALTAEGHFQLVRWFGHLFTPGWDPGCNGFQVAG